MTIGLENIIFLAFKIVGIGVGIPLFILFFTGMFTAILQAVTQIQDQILGFFPKIAITFVLILISGPGLLELIKDLLAECIKASSKIH